MRGSESKALRRLAWVGLFAGASSIACRHHAEPTDAPERVAAAEPAATRDTNPSLAAKAEPRPREEAAPAESPHAAHPDQPPDPDDVPLDVTLDIDALVRLGASLPATSRDDRYLAIETNAELAEPSSAKRFEVWVFTLEEADFDMGTSPEVLPLVTADDARRAATRPTVGVRDRIVMQVRIADDRLVALGFDEPKELAEDYDLVEKGDALLKRWTLRPFTIVENATDRGTLVVKKGKQVVKTIGSPYGPEDAGQCLEWQEHQVFPAPDGQGWLVLTHIGGPPVLGCDPKPRLRRVDRP